MVTVKPFGYSAYVSIDKAITHAFGINLQYDRGETRQGWFNTKNAAPDASAVGARTQYDAISLLGDINFSNLLRRVDNHSLTDGHFMDMLVLVLLPTEHTRKTEVTNRH